MLDYDKLKKGDLVMAELAQSKGKQYRAVVVEPMQWRPNAKIGRIGLRIDHHADVCRWLSVHRTQGVETGGHDELHPWMLSEPMKADATGSFDAGSRYTVPWGGRRIAVGAVFARNFPDLPSQWWALLAVPFGETLGFLPLAFESQAAAEAALVWTATVALYPNELIDGKKTPVSPVAK